jgi:endonuclease/exonuclease/phosphatase family metal-dependent hydrolase
VKRAIAAVRPGRLCAVPVRAILAWLLVAPCVAWAVVRLAGLERGYPLVQIVAYTPLAAIGAVVVVVVAAALRQRLAAVVAAVVALALAVVVAPRALGGESDADGRSLRVLSANLHHSPSAAPGLVALVRRTRPDVLSLQEATPAVVEALDAAGLPDLLPERVVATPADIPANALYARTRLGRIAAPQRQTNPLAAARIGREVEIYAVHPRAPIRRRATTIWRAELRALPPATPDGRIRILAGDFNATLDHAELRRLLDTGYEDAADAVGAGLSATWPQGRRFPPPVTIDHVLADERVGFRAVSVHSLPRTDHRAVLAELVLPR